MTPGEWAARAAPRALDDEGLLLAALLEELNLLRGRGGGAAALVSRRRGELRYDMGCGKKTASLLRGKGAR